ncbi:MAG: hypothetical protein R6V85_11665 [Polyangia bacterium]
MTMRAIAAALVLAVALGWAACGKSEEQLQEQRAKQEIEEIRKDFENLDEQIEAATEKVAEIRREQRALLDGGSGQDDAKQDGGTTGEPEKEDEEKK